MPKKKGHHVGMLKPHPASYCPRDCKYLAKQSVASECSCDYILIENEPRGCKPGNGCTKYVKGKHPKPNNGIYEFY